MDLMMILGQCPLKKMMKTCDAFPWERKLIEQRRKKCARNADVHPVKNVENPSKTVFAPVVKNPLPSAVANRRSNRTVSG